MALNRKHRAMLSGQVLVDRKFREAFLKNPKKAAKTLSIELSDQQHQEMLNFAEQIRQLGQRSDKLLMNTKTNPTFIPFIVLA